MNATNINSKIYPTTYTLSVNHPDFDWNEKDLVFCIVHQKQILDHIETIFDCFDPSVSYTSEDTTNLSHVLQFLATTAIDICQSPRGETFEAAYFKWLHRAFTCPQAKPMLSEFLKKIWAPTQWSKLLQNQKKFFYLILLEMRYAGIMERALPHIINNNTIIEYFSHLHYNTKDLLNIIMDIISDDSGIAASMVHHLSQIHLGIYEDIVPNQMSAFFLDLITAIKGLNPEAARQLAAFAFAHFVITEDPAQERMFQLSSLLPKGWMPTLASTGRRIIFYHMGEGTGIRESTIYFPYAKHEPHEAAPRLTELMTIPFSQFV